METLIVINNGYNEVEARRTPCSGKRRTLTGYDKNLPTDVQVFFAGRWRRVYSTCYSNAASMHINYNGGKVHVI